MVPNSVSLRLPRGWIALDPRQPDLLTELQQAIITYWADQQREAPIDAEELLGLLAPLTLDLHKVAGIAEIVLVALYTQVFPAGPDELPLVVSANATLAVTPLPPDLTDPASLRDLVGKGGSGINGEPEIRTTDLPTGRSVLVCGLTEISDETAEISVPGLLRRYFIPIPAAHRLAVLSFVTPNVELAESFDPVFAAMAASLAFEREPAGAEASQHSSDVANT